MKNPFPKEMARIARALDGSLESAILLQLIMHWFQKQWNGHDAYTPFYKFMTPSPEHATYKEGESWLEIIGTTAAKLKAAVSKISTRTTSSGKARAVKRGTRLALDEILSHTTAEFNDVGIMTNAKFLVYRYTNRNNITYWGVNISLYNSLLSFTDN